MNGCNINHKPCFEEEFSQFLDKRKLVKMQWLQEQNQSSEDNANYVIHEASRHFRNKKKKCK